MLMVTRESASYRARFICRCSFIPSVGGSTTAGEIKLREAFASSDMSKVAALHLGDGAGRDGAWFVGDDWWLSAPGR